MEATLVPVSGFFVSQVAFPRRVPSQEGAVDGVNVTSLCTNMDPHAELVPGIPAAVKRVLVLALTQNYDPL